MLNKTVKGKILRLFAIIAITALIIFASILLYGYLILRDLSKNELVKEVVIPNSRYKAVAFVNNSGALSNYIAGVSILDTNDCLSNNDRGNIFNCDGCMLVNVAIINDSSLLLRYQGDSNLVINKKEYRGIHIELSNIMPSQDRIEHSYSAREKYNANKADVQELMNDQDELLKYHGMEFNDKEWGQRIYIDSANVYIRKLNGGFYKVNTTTGIDWNPFHSPKAVLNIRPPMKLVSYNSFLLKHNITKMYWSMDDVCFMKIGENGDWLWFSKNQKDKDYIGKTFTTSIGYKLSGGNSQVYIINPHWKFAVAQ